MERWETKNADDIVFDIESLSAMITLVGRRQLKSNGIPGELREMECKIVREQTRRKIARIQPYQRDLMHFIKSNRKIKLGRR